MWEEEKEGGWDGKEEKTCHTKWESKRTSHLEHLWDFGGPTHSIFPSCERTEGKNTFSRKVQKHASSSQVWNETKNRMSSEPKILYNFQRRTCHMLMGNYAVRLTRSCTIQIDSQIAKQDVSAALFRKKNRKWGREGACNYVVSCEYFKTNPIMSVFGLLILPEEKTTKNENIYWYE